MSGWRRKYPTNVQVPAAFAWPSAQAGLRTFDSTSDPARTTVAILMLADAISILIASVGSHFLYHGWVIMRLEVASTTLLAILLMLNTMQITGGYRGPVLTPPTRRIATAVRGWSVVFMILSIVAYLTKLSDNFSRAWAINWFLLALSGFVLTRMALAPWTRRRARAGKLSSTVAIVDMTGNGEGFARRLLSESSGQARLLGVFSPNAPPDRQRGIPDLIELARLIRVDDVLVAVSDHGGNDVDGVLRQLGTIPTNVHVCPEIAPLKFVPRDAGMLYGQAVLTIHQRPLLGWKRIAKRLEDVVIASVMLIALLPILLIIAAAIRLDSPGPVLFRQRRVGFNTSVITVLKFRSMMACPASDAHVPQARRNDPRVTRVGRFLRRSSLDELPQLLNVLRGDMSLVGPRPHAVVHDEHYAKLMDDYLGRHRVKPGITGWAQVNGFRGETETLDKMQRRVEHDLAYIDSWSIVLDLKILLLTLLRGAFNQKAY